MPKKALPFICLFLLFLMAASCSASSVSRSFSKATAYMDESIMVNLTVSITSGETFYAIDENYPSGWEIISTTGNFSQLGHVKWVVAENAVNTTHSYTIKIPMQPGTHTFSGIYMFENMIAEATISGSSQVTVIAQGDIDGNSCVDIGDLAAIGLDFGKTSGFADPDSDINKNGSVDIFDLVVVGKEFGAGC